MQRNVKTYAPIRLEFVTARPTQAIVTQIIGATNYKPARIRAKACGGTIIKSIPIESESDDWTHAWAARQLCVRFGWHGRLVCGGMPDGRTRVFVFVPE